MSVVRAGTGGAVLDGGQRETLAKSNHFVKDSWLRDSNRWLLNYYDQASRDLGLGKVEAVDPLKAGAADVSFVAGIAPKVLDGIGLMGDGGHTVKEVADLTTLPSQTKRAAVLLYRLSTALRGE